MTACGEMKGSMPHYMLQVSYTPDAWRKLIETQEDRTKPIAQTIEKLGGRAVNTWFSFGDYDLVVIFQMPGNVNAAAFAMAAGAGGAVTKIKTTPLMEVSEGLAALKQAAASGYRPPGK